MRAGLVLVWALAAGGLGGAVSLAGPAVAAAPTAPTAGRVQAAKAQAEYDNALRNPEVRRYFDDRLTDKQREIDQLKRQSKEATDSLATARGRSRQDRAEIERLTARVNQLTTALAEAQTWFVDELAKRDRELAREIAVFRDTVTPLLGTPEGLRIVELANAGDVEASRLLADELRAAGKRRRNIDEAVFERGLAMLYLGKSTVTQSISDFERVAALDPDVHRDWMELSRLYLLANRLAKAEHAAAEAERTAANDRDRMMAWVVLGEVHSRYGTAQAQGRALDYYEQAASVAEARAKDQPDSAQALSDLSFAYVWTADLLVAEPNGQSKALDFYSKSLAIREALAQPLFGDALGQRDLSVSYERLANFWLGQTNGQAAALGYSGKSLTIREAMVERDPDNRTARRDLSVNYLFLGDVWRTLPEGQGKALDYYGRSLTIFEALAREDAGDALGQRDLSIGHERLGYYWLSQPGGQAKALDHYHRSLEIRERLALEVNDAGAHRDLSLSYATLGEFWLGQPGGQDQAFDYFSKSLIIAEALARQDPGSALFMRDLSLSYNHLGDAWLAQPGGQTKALGYYDKGLVIAERLVGEDGGYAPAHRDLAVSYWKMASAAAPGHSWQRVVDQFERMQADGLLASSDQEYLNEARRRRDKDASKVQGTP